MAVFKVCGRDAGIEDRNFATDGRMKVFSREMPLEPSLFTGKVPRRMSSSSHSGLTSCVAEISEAAIDALAANVDNR